MASWHLFTLGPLVQGLGVVLVVIVIKDHCIVNTIFLIIPLEHKTVSVCSASSTALTNISGYYKSICICTSN